MNRTKIKPGFVTTEFATAAAAQLISLLVLWHCVPAGEASSLEDAVKAILLAVGALASNAYIIVGYIKSRTAIKTAAMANGNGQSALPPLGGALR